MYKIKVQMKRGGFMPMLADARIYNDSDGAGQKWVEVEITSLQWPGGGEVNEMNIADMTQVQDAVFEAAENARDNRE